MDNIKNLIKDFLEGKIDIIEFKELCNKDDSIYDFLQKIIDEIKENNGRIEHFPFEIGDDIIYSDEEISYLLQPETDPSLKYGCPPHYNSVKQMLNYENSGMSVMEMSHRSSSYLDIFQKTKDLLKKVMNVPDNYKIVFIQGGATQQFSMVPLNLLKNGKADYIITGSFSKKAANEAKKYGEINIAYDGSVDNFKHIPTQDELKLDPEASYVHLCSNNTIYGTEWKYVPETNGVPIIADMSSNILSKPIDVSKYGMIYAGAQKNMGIAGLGVAIIKEELLQKVPAKTPVLLDYQLMIDNDSMYNTPPAYAIYVLGLVLEWIDNLGGLEVMEQRNIKKAKLLYDYLDSSDFYICHSDKDNRSLMNVTFTTPNKDLDAKFVKESIEAGMTNLKGHRSVGGIRASIYNAMPIEGVEKLIAFMKDFEIANK